MTRSHMVLHAIRRGAVTTPDGIGTLTDWPPTSARARVTIRGRHLRPLKDRVEPIVCDYCHQPADPTLAAHGTPYCIPCHQAANRQHTTNHKDTR